MHTTQTTTDSQPTRPVILSETADLLTVRFSGDIVATFSPGDKELVLWKNWMSIRLTNNRVYFKTNITYRKTRKTVYLHRMIKGTPDGLTTDHIDRNTLNNTRGNIRVLTHSQNSKNNTKSKGKTSAFVGVHFDKNGKRWRAKAVHEGKIVGLGSFNTEREAALARNSFVSPLVDQPYIINDVNTLQT